MGMGEDILVVKKENLFKDRKFQGFMPIEEFDFFPIILNNFEYAKRTIELENDESWQQPIPYVWIINSKNKQVFLYKRAKSGNESRLHEKISGGIGGHIDKDSEKESKNPIEDAMIRELREEVSMKEYPKPRLVGYIKLDGGVEAVHFGIVAIVDTILEVMPLEDMESGKFYSLEEAENMIENPKNNVERWTKASWNEIKRILT